MCHCLLYLVSASVYICLLWDKVPCLPQPPTPHAGLAVACSHVLLTKLSGSLHQSQGVRTPTPAMWAGVQRRGSKFLFGFWGHLSILSILNIHKWGEISFNIHHNKE